MRHWLPYIAAFGLGLASAMAGSFAGFMIVMSGPGFDIAGFVSVAILLPMAVAYAVFVVTYAGFSDRWIGWTNATVGGAFVFAATMFCFGLITQDVLEEMPAAILLMIILFAGGRLLLKRADLV